MYTETTVWQVGEEITYKGDETAAEKAPENTKSATSAPQTKDE
tara:strand:+ start:529 stop:657 length:129 start_codon:yes stop_codon:yes gene_type:complete